MRFTIVLYVFRVSSVVNVSTARLTRLQLGMIIFDDDRKIDLGRHIFRGSFIAQCENSENEDRDSRICTSRIANRERFSAKTPSYIEPCVYRYDEFDKRRLKR